MHVHVGLDRQFMCPSLVRGPSKGGGWWLCEKRVPMNGPDRAHGCRARICMGQGAGSDDLYSLSLRDFF